MASIVRIKALKAAWTNDVWASYSGPPAYSMVSPGSTADFAGRQAAIIKAGLAADSASGNYEDDGILAFRIAAPIASFAAQSLTFDVAPDTGTNPVWATIRWTVSPGVTQQYQFVPTANPVGWHTVNAAAGLWQKWADDQGTTTGGLITLAQVAADNPDVTVDRVYLRLGMGNSYNVSPGVGTVAWVDKVTIGTQTFDFETIAGTYEVDPVSRIEGHLGVKVVVDAAGTITEANAHGNLWRGFENFLIGRQANDAITFTQRICGVCPVPHGTAATNAADSVLGVSNGYATFAQIGGAGDGVPPAAVLVRNMVLGAEFLMSSITHFYHLVAQSYVQGPPIPPWTPYFPTTQYAADLVNPGLAVPNVNGSGVPAELWSAVIKQYVKALRIRRLTFEAGALFAGRMPMMSMSVAGGTTNRFKDRADFIDKCNAFRSMMEEVGKFVITEYVPLTLALGALYPGYDNNQVAGAGNLPGYGAGLGNFLAWGGFPGTSDAGTLALQGGWKLKGSAAINDLLVNRANLGAAKALVELNLKEVITASRYANTGGYEDGDSMYPGNVTRTEPDRDTVAKYSWMKAPRWNGEPMEVGPFARMVVNGKYLVDGSNLVTSGGSGAPAAYGALYLNAGGTGLDLSPNVIHGDLAAGLGSASNPSGSLVGAVQSYVMNLKGGLSTMDRLRARAIESFWMVNFLIGGYTKATGTFSGGWVDELKALWPAANPLAPVFYRATTPPIGTVKGYGLVEAPRGALGHFITANNGKIAAYQCVVPTTWNGSPKDGVGVVNHDNTSATKRGAMEQAMIDVPFDATVTIPADAVTGKRAALSGVEVLRVAQSFDPCIACAVH